jgi:hypothetical protein
LFDSRNSHDNNDSAVPINNHFDDSLDQTLTLEDGMMMEDTLLGACFPSFVLALLTVASHPKPPPGNTQHNTTQHNTTQHNTAQHNTKQHNTTQHNTTQHNTAQHNTTQHKKHNTYHLLSEKGNMIEESQSA